MEDNDFTLIKCGVFSDAQTLKDCATPFDTNGDDVIPALGNNDFPSDIFAAPVCFAPPTDAAEHSDTFRQIKELKLFDNPNIPPAEVFEVKSDAYIAAPLKAPDELSELFGRSPNTYKKRKD